MNEENRTSDITGEEYPTPGWDAISAAFERLYPRRPIHYGALLPWSLGGNDPLDGISAYDGGGFYHFVTYGFSELYEKESENQEYSGYGFELTLKLKKPAEEEEIRCVCGILQSLARYVFEEGAVIRPYEYIYTGQENGMDVRGESKLTGFFTLPDEAGKIETPNGKLEFVQLVGATDAELRAVVDQKLTVPELAERVGTSLTDYSRAACI